MNGLKEAANNFNALWNGCSNTFEFIKNCFTDGRFLIDKIKFIAPEIILVTLGILIILKMLGFKDTNKWIGLALVIALLISAL